MPNFAYITDLPPQVRGTLDVSLQELWLAAFNAAITVTNNEAEAYQAAWLKVFQQSFPGEVASMPNMMPPSPLPGMTQGAMAPYVSASEHMGYWIDLNRVTLNDGGPTWIQAMPVGEYMHPRHGKINLTPERIMRFAQNVKSRVRGTDLDIDYDHKEHSGEAAGWVVDANAVLNDPDPGKNGLWIAVNWTQKAFQSLKDKAYRYFSPEFADEWVHPKTNQKYQDVLFGGGITNRPFLKDILPINFSEIIGGNQMDEATRKFLAKHFGLADTATEAEVRAKMVASDQPAGNEPPNTGTPAPTQPSGEPGNDNGQQTQPTTTTTTTTQPPATPAQPEQIAATDPRNPTMIALAEKDPVVRALMDRVLNLETANKLAEIDRKVSDIQHGNVALDPATAEELKKVAVQLPHQLTEQVMGLVTKIVTGQGTVQLGEVGGTVGGITHNDGSATVAFTDLIAKEMAKTQGLSYADAVEIVANNPENYQLYEGYRRESWLKEGV